MTIQEIKQTLFAYRNGVVADTLRKSGDPHSSIFGLILPQLSQIATQIGKNEELSLQLWDYKNSRECRLLAIMLLPVENSSLDFALTLINDCINDEELDILCHKYLSHAIFANQLVDYLIDSVGKSNNYAYAALRLVLNLIQQHKLRYDSSLDTRIQPIALIDIPKIQSLIYQIKHYE